MILSQEKSDCVQIGLDVGSTTLKCVVLDESGQILYHNYERHYSQIAVKVSALLKTIASIYPEERFSIAISGSAGMGLAQKQSIPFIQEVYATRVSIGRLLPDTDTVIELGGEDAKILFLRGGLEVRMNGTCAGGTGAFIDQMATLMGMTPEEMNDCAKNYKKIYTIASRCGVFAKSDIQPLMNQGAQKNDISASIFAAVVNQTIAGLAQGRIIEGNVVYLGGPLTFLSELRKAFDRIMNVTGTNPEYALYYVALGAAYLAEGDNTDLLALADRIEQGDEGGDYIGCAPLFHTQKEYQEFKERHDAEHVSALDPATDYRGRIYIGVDSGSTTVKAVAVTESEEILTSVYLPNRGNPIALVKEFIESIYHNYPNAVIASSAVTGYGEEIVKNAFRFDDGLVETIAHYIAAKKFEPDVDFIIDIGGQDIKCFQIHNGVIDNIFLNEACSSGCGSFLQTFAQSWGSSIADFAKLGLFGDKPVDLGSRCTVFMNSSVKQAQKDGASIENISAGLSISVVKNALYKVIRAASTEKLGEHIVVQGGTFLNDAVLRAFEMEIGGNVVRPNIAGLMGAFGAALYAKQSLAAKQTGMTAVSNQTSSILTPEELEAFTHHVAATVCRGCANHCRLTVNTFDGGRKYIGGNRCEKPLAIKSNDHAHNLYEYKRTLLAAYPPVRGSRGKIGIPMVLNLYELLPFWHTLFTELGFEVITSPPSTRKLYLLGQQTIPSDTVCYPAKLVHGHIEALIESGVDTIFYPCLSYNFDEGQSDNHYNCPVVAYYPEVISANMPSIEKVKFLHPYFGIHRPRDFTKRFLAFLNDNFSAFGAQAFEAQDVKSAVAAAYAEYDSYMKKVRDKGLEYLNDALEQHSPVIVLCGRPYHLDEEISHGIDKLIAQTGATVVTEDAVASLGGKAKTLVLNQWTYHARLYSAAQYVARSGNPDLNLVQLVSFGCGVDAITTDEVRRILESNGKIYTQIKIDEITNLGAVKIRLRSLFSAIELAKEESDACIKSQNA